MQIYCIFLTSLLGWLSILHARLVPRHNGTCANMLNKVVSFRLNLLLRRVNCASPVAFLSSSVGTTLSCSRVSAHRLSPLVPKATLSTTQNEVEAASHACEQDPARLILSRAVNYVPTHGWSTQSLIAGINAATPWFSIIAFPAATDLGYSSAAHGLFPRGAAELVVAAHVIDIPAG